MKRTFLLQTITILALILSSCDRETIRVSEEVSSKTFNLSDFKSVTISDTFNAYVRFSDTEERIVVEANNNLFDRIIVRTEGDQLVAGIERNTNIRGNATLNIFITTADIERFEASGASRIFLEDTWIAPDASVSVSGASELHGELSAGFLDLHASGASAIDLFGNVAEMEATLDGSSHLRDYDLEVGRLQLNLSGASDAQLTITDLLDLNASGASNLSYKGNPQMGTITLSGASEVHRKE